MQNKTKCPSKQKTEKAEQIKKLLSLKGKLSLKDVSAELEAAEIKDVKRLNQRTRQS